MKWNWGTKLFIAIVLFMGFMIVLFIMTLNQDYDLVEKDYYPKALAYQHTIDKESNARALGERVKVENAGENVVFTFQDDFDPDSITGNIYFYRPSDRNGDDSIPIRLDSARCQVYNTANLLKGKYIVKIDYRANGKSYFQEQTILIRMF